MTQFNKILTLSILAVLLLAAVLPFSAVLAETTSVDGFDDSSIYEDLNGATILGKTFDVNDYPANENGTPELLAFTEFAFSLKHEYQPYYGLYLYVYYPQGNLDDSQLNTVEMANKYEDGQAVNWSKYTLKLLDRDYNGVLYKFKIMDSTEPEHTISETYARVAMSSAERRYDINSIELHQKDTANAVDYGIGGTWTITGYSKGMHESSMEQSTLLSEARFQNTLKLDVHSTYYRGWLNYANTVADQLSSVYFSVDNKIDQEYDRLYALKFDAYKYLSSPMFAIYDKHFWGSAFTADYDQIYKNLLNQRGMSTDAVRKLNEYSWMHWGHEGTPSGGETVRYYYAQEKPLVDLETATYWDKLAWVFQTDKESDHKIASEVLLQYMSDFSKQFGADIRGKYNSLLFADQYYTVYGEYANKTVVNGQNIGRTITADEEWELRGSLAKNTFWKHLQLLFKHTEQQPNEFYPIQKVEWDDIKNMSDETIAQTYFVAESDVPVFKFYVKQQNDINKSVYLFRYDIDTFVTEPLFCENMLNKVGYVAQEPIYLDFDIISLTYDKAGVQTVIPVVSNPIDIVAGIEPPGNNLDLELEFKDFKVSVYTMLILFLLAVVVIVFIWPAIKYIFKGK